MKKLLSIILAVMLVFALAACGDGGTSDPSGGGADGKNKFEGKYISVAGEMLGMVLTGEDIAGFEIEIKADGEGVMTIEGESADIEWTNEGDTVTITVEGEDLTAKHSKDTLVFDDFMGMGMKLTFAIEGSPAADPSLYVSEEIKEITGTWTSYEVTDVLGDDASGEMDPGGLSITFNSDYTASGDILGIDLELEDYTWTIYDGYGFFENADASVITDFELTEDGGLEVTYDDGENYYIFICEK